MAKRVIGCLHKCKSKETCKHPCCKTFKLQTVSSSPVDLILEDVFLIICQYLSYKDVVSINSTCRRWNNFTKARVFQELELTKPQFEFGSERRLLRAKERISLIKSKGYPITSITTHHPFFLSPRYFEDLDSVEYVKLSKRYYFFVLFLLFLKRKTLIKKRSEFR